MMAFTRFLAVAIVFLMTVDGVRAVEPDAPKKMVKLQRGKIEAQAAVGEPKKADEVSKSDISDAEPSVPKHPVVQLVLDKLGKGKGRQTTALRTFYGADERKPVWVYDQGFTKSGEDVIGEIGRADEFGLKASAFKLPKLDGDSPSDQDLAAAELKLARAILAYARHAKGGRISPKQAGSQLDKAPVLLKPVVVLDGVTNSGDAVEYLRSLHPQHPQFIKLGEKLAELRDGPKGVKGPKIPTGPVLKLGVVHDQVSLLRQRLDVEGEGKEFDADVEKAVKLFQKSKGVTADGVVGNGTRGVLNGGGGNNSQVSKIILNMERWRWLPADLDGEAGMHVWANIPEFRVRVQKDYETVFSERAIVGLVTHKTPVFSDMMEWIEIHPTWYVPNSIKVGDILPSLKRPTSTVMERYNLKLNCGAAGSNAKTIDWSKVNISGCSVTQPPGPKSVLGDFKFKFPNRHSVYMHDTDKKGLFSSVTRTFSHGCVRVKQPRRMAEVLLEHQNTLTSERLGKILKGPQKLHRAVFKHAVPVHITYFTMVYDDDGKLVSRPDYYGHDKRLAALLRGGNYVAPTAQGAVTPATGSAVKKTAQADKKKKTAKKETNWWDDLLTEN